MRWMLSWVACVVLVMLPAATSTVAAPAGRNVPTLTARELAKWIPGKPLGPWAEALQRPVVFLIWSPGKPAPESAEVVRRIAGRYAHAGLGVRFLCINGPELPLPSVRIPKRHARNLVAPAGPDAERMAGTTGGIPASLIRHPDGRLEWRGKLDLEHGGYNLIIGIKQALALQFSDLEPLRAVDLAGPNGEPVHLERFLDGLGHDVVFLSIWGTWCSDSRRALPHLVRLAERFGATVGFVGIACEKADIRREQWESVQTFLQDSALKVSFPILLGDLWGLRLRVPQFLGYPTMLLLRRGHEDGNGWRVLWQQVGFEAGDERRIARALLETLAEDARH